jgi:glycosyltransferase involved in cell wall biosynthesis
VSVISPGFVIEQLPDRRDARRRFGLPDDTLCVAVVGSLTAGRGQDVVLRALAQLQAAGRDAHALVVGVPHPRTADIAYKERLVELATSLRVRDRVVFAGFLDDVRVAYAAADIVVNPARVSEAFGRVAFEALAAGKPVVSTRVGAIPELLTPEVHVLLVESGDAEGIARAVIRLADDAALRERIVAAGQCLVRERYSIEEGVDAFCRVVDGVVGGRPAIA